MHVWHKIFEHDRVKKTEKRRREAFSAKYRADQLKEMMADPDIPEEGPWGSPFMVQKCKSSPRYKAFAGKEG